MISFALELVSLLPPFLYCMCCDCADSPRREAATWRSNAVSRSTTHVPLFTAIGPTAVFFADMAR
ncbi:hypothetical protein BDW22DRAFT_405090 [Trametopsis cervina]|nr:hypothetical protein BDW22DRAFT_405090 [Trametopsis cervina]